MTTLIYMIAGLLWAFYAAKQQLYLTDDLIKMYWCFILNFLFWPIGMLFAIIRT